MWAKLSRYIIIQRLLPTTSSNIVLFFFFLQWKALCALSNACIRLGPNFNRRWVSFQLVTPTPLSTNDENHFDVHACMCRLHCALIHLLHSENKCLATSFCFILVRWTLWMHRKSHAYEILMLFNDRLWRCLWSYITYAKWKTSQSYYDSLNGLLLIHARDLKRFFKIDFHCEIKVWQPLIQLKPNWQNSFKYVFRACFFIRKIE